MRNTERAAYRIAVEACNEANRRHMLLGGLPDGAPDGYSIGNGGYGYDVEVQRGGTGRVAGVRVTETRFDSDKPSKEVRIMGLLGLCALTPRGDDSKELIDRFMGCYREGGAGIIGHNPYELSDIDRRIGYNILGSVVDKTRSIPKLYGADGDDCTVVYKLRDEISVKISPELPVENYIPKELGVKYEGGVTFTDDASGKVFALLVYGRDRGGMEHTRAVSLPLGVDLTAKNTQALLSAVYAVGDQPDKWYGCNGKKNTLPGFVEFSSTELYIIQNIAQGAK